MATNNIKPFAIGNGANVTSQSDYEALSALLTGFQSGKASSAQINKALRQATFIASVIAQFISDKAAVDVLDNGNTTTLMSNLIAALKANGATDFLQKSSNLTDLADKPQALSVLGGAPLDSPTFTGTPKGPTAAVTTNNTQFATTAFVQAISGLMLKASSNLSEISAAGDAAKLTARTNLGLESVIGQLANGNTFASCTSKGYYLVTITDPTSVSDMPKFNGVYASGNGFLFVTKSETSISQVYITSNGGTCSRFKLGSGSFSGWDFKYSATYTPTLTNLGIGDVGTGQVWTSFDTTQRASNVVYTNNTGRPIMISVTSGTASTSRLVVNGVNMSNTIITGSSGGGLFVGSVIVPVGATYQLTSSAPASSWAELR